MNRNRKSAALAVLCIIAVQGFGTRRASAELLPKEQLQSCQLHVVGIYAPKDQSKDDRVFIKVRPTPKPVVLVLSGYFGAQWNIEIDKDADVRQIIIPGYFEHFAVGAPESIPTEFITYFPKGENSRDFFWAYSWHSSNGRKLRTRLKEITGLEIATFQGEYSGTSFVVDGKLGRIDEGGPAPAPQEGPTQELLKAHQAMRAQGRQLEMQRQQFLSQYGASHPLVRQLERSLELMQAELSRVGADPIAAVSNEDAAVAQPAVPTGADQRAVIETLVRQSFELETQLQMSRVEKAQADLQRVKLQLKERQKNAEQIIKDRVDQLVKQDGLKADQSANIPASVLSSEGWAAWNKHDWRTALTKFQAALAKDPQDATAQNGLGWTYVHLREYDKAIAEFKRLLKKSPTHGGAMNGLGQSLLMQGKLDEAERELLKATEDVISQWGETKAASEGVAAWYGLARTYMRKKDYSNARKWIERYLKHKPNDQIMNAMLKEIDAAEAAVDAE